MSVVIVSIEANIAAGKTTLIENLLKKDHHNVIFHLVPEPVDTWKKIMIGNCDALTKFYNDMHGTALPFQLIALLTRKQLFDLEYEKAKKIAEETGKKVILISERTILSDKHIFARMLHESGFINESGIVAYNMWNEHFAKELPVDKIVYINTSPAVCYERVHFRNRGGEETISFDYLNTCHQAHQRFYDEIITNMDHKIIDTSNIFLETEEYLKLVDSVIDYFNE